MVIWEFSGWDLGQFVEFMPFCLSLSTFWMLACLHLIWSFQNLVVGIWDSVLNLCHFVSLSTFWMSILFFTYGVMKKDSFHLCKCITQFTIHKSKISASIIWSFSVSNSPILVNCCNNTYTIFFTCLCLPLIWHCFTQISDPKQDWNCFGGSTTSIIYAYNSRGSRESPKRTIDIWYQHIGESPKNTIWGEVKLFCFNSFIVT